MLGFVLQLDFDRLGKIQFLALAVCFRAGCVRALLGIFIHQRHAFVRIAHINVRRIGSHCLIHLQHLIEVRKNGVLIRRDGHCRAGNRNIFNGNQHFFAVFIVKQRFIALLERLCRCIGVGNGVCILCILLNDVDILLCRRRLDRIVQNAEVVGLVLVKIDDGLVLEIVHGLRIEFFLRCRVLHAGKRIAQLLSVRIRQRQNRLVMRRQHIAGDVCCHLAHLGSRRNGSSRRNIELFVRVLIQESNVERARAGCTCLHRRLLSAHVQIQNGIVAFALLHQAERAQNNCRLRTGRAVLRPQIIDIVFLGAVDELVGHRPVHGIFRPRNTVSVRKLGQIISLYRLLSRIVVQELRKLLARHIGIRIEAIVSHARGIAVFIRPFDRSKIPIRLIDIGKAGRIARHLRIAGFVVQNPHNHRARHDGVRLKLGRRCAVHEFVVVHVLYGVTVPAARLDIRKRHAGDTGFFLRPRRFGCKRYGRQHTSQQAHGQHQTGHSFFPVHFFTSLLSARSAE